MEDKNKNIDYSEKRYSSLIKAAPDGIITVNTKGIITTINPAFIRLTGSTKKEIIGKHLSMLPAIQKTDALKYVKIFQSILRDKQPLKTEFYFKKTDGDTSLVEVRAGLIKKNGKVLEIQGIFRDITEQRNTENFIKLQCDLANKLSSISNLSKALKVCVDTA
ncbi:MAG: PAS domain S-box protein, partial [Actinobacteria bacterium]|nr:PAS domain S-box protein [Actinomycetota bacterium]